MYMPMLSGWAMNGSRPAGTAASTPAVIATTLLVPASLAIR